jgi:hypothetical protein
MSSLTLLLKSLTESAESALQLGFMAVFAFAQFLVEQLQLLVIGLTDLVFDAALFGLQISIRLS